MRRADHSFRGVIPTVVRRCVCYRNLNYEEPNINQQWLNLRDLFAGGDRITLVSLHVRLPASQHISLQNTLYPDCWLKEREREREKLHHGNKFNIHSVLLCCAVFCVPSSLVYLSSRIFLQATFACNSFVKKCLTSEDVILQVKLGL
jgi:hypothetical protein